MNKKEVLKIRKEGEEEREDLGREGGREKRGEKEGRGENEG